MTQITEQERRLLEDVRRTNDHPNGFRSHVLSGTGGKGSNFSRINLEKRATSLVAKGLLAETPYGYEITPAGRSALDTTAA